MNNGLSSAVSDVLTDNCIALDSFKRFGIPQVYPGFGDAKELYKKYGYDKESVQNYIRMFILINFYEGRSGEKQCLNSILVENW